MKAPACLIVVSVLWASTASAQVPYQRIVAANSEPQHWLTYSGNYASHRFSPLDEITADNVDGLRTTWVYQLKRSGVFETSPIIADGVMYITEPPSTVSALDIHTGRSLWTWTPDIPRDVRYIGFPAVNRGVAILDDQVFVGTLDAHLVSLDAKSGAVLWDVVVADNSTGHSITCAPLAIDGKVIVGISGGEVGIRGFLDAYDAKTGKRLWRYWTIPGPGEEGHETWTPSSWKTGAGPTWITGSYDPELDLLYWGVGNPGPDWNGDLRPGDNLFTCCVLALRPSTGEKVWHFQYTPHDVFDWDACQIQVLVDAEFKGRPRKLLVTANRNAFYYVLDRVTGEFLHAAPYSKQTWASGIDADGRPVRIPGTNPTKEGVLVFPSLQGGTNWFSPSYSPQEKTLFVAVREMGAYYFKSDVDFEPGQAFMGGGEQTLLGDQALGWIRALEVTSGKKKWEFRLHSPPWAGLLSTSGGIVFGGTDEGNFFALDAKTGNKLWQFQTGGKIKANPISFAIDGKQQVAIAAGNSLFVFGLP